MERFVWPRHGAPDSEQGGVSTVDSTNALRHEDGVSIVNVTFGRKTPQK